MYTASRKRRKIKAGQDRMGANRWSRPTTRVLALSPGMLRHGEENTRCHSGNNLVSMPPLEAGPAIERREDRPADQIVRYEDVSKTFDGVKLVISGLNLCIRRGEFLTMLGPSGSGKTTCLMMLAGFEAPTSGDIFLEGRSLTNVPPHRRNIGMVFQNYALFPHLTVAENLAFPLRSRKISKSEIKTIVDRALDMVQLVGLGDRYPSQLSGGQQQRVAVARALVYEPALVLMDEPLGALDKQLREQMQFELKRIHRHLGVTFVYVTHDQAEALTISDRIAVFNRGQVEQIACPSELYEAPKTLFVADFLGENNRLPCVVREASNDICRLELNNGDIVTAVPAGISQANQTAWCCIRPESVRVNPAEGTCDNLFPAEVLEQTYLGDHLRIRLETCGCEDFIVKIQRHPHRPALSVGDACMVGWRYVDCRALRET